jgi:hypothetical protein
MSILAGGLLELGGTLIRRLIPDKEAAAKAQLELALMQQNGELQELQTRMSAILAEANSADPWTSRARPSFMYVFYFVIIMLTFVAPLIGIFSPDAMSQFYTNVAYGFEAIPEELWWTFTVGYLGYSGARTFEKRKGVAK